MEPEEPKDRYHHRPGFRRFSAEEKKRAVDYFFDTPNATFAQVVKDLGYPGTESTLRKWVEKDHRYAKIKNASYTPEERSKAIDCYFGEGERNCIKTIGILGYPTREGLMKWVRMDPRYKSKAVKKPRTYSEEEQQAVVDYYFEHPEMTRKDVIAHFGYPSYGFLTHLIQNDPRHDSKRLFYSKGDREAILTYYYEHIEEISVDELLDEFGYPGRQAFESWLSKDPRYKEIQTKRKQAVVDYYYDTPGASIQSTHDRFGWLSKATIGELIKADPRHATDPRRACRKYTLEEKKNAVEYLMSNGLSCAAAGADLGVPAGTLAYWARQYREKGLSSLVTSVDLNRREAPRKTTVPEFLEVKARVANEDVAAELCALREENERLAFENDVLRATIDVLKKDPGLDDGDDGELSNAEKTMLIDALRPKHKLKDLLHYMSMAKSSYEYQREVMRRPDKYAVVRNAIREIFESAEGRRGYRYVHRKLRERKQPIVVSEKVVRRIMAEEGLEVVYVKKGKRSFSSYQGEISEAPNNLVNRNFHADRPNELWLTDITEFRLPDPGEPKVYLSPILDCFDGGIVSWSIGTSPSAELANSSLEGACEKLGAEEHPVCHSDRGSHYRWPGWISICERHGLVRSMSKKGCSPDNSACEGFFGRLKNEFFYYRDWSGVSAEQFVERLDAWIRYYNEERIKESLGWMSPHEYRRSLGYAA